MHDRLLQIVRTAGDATSLKVWQLQDIQTLAAELQTAASTKTISDVHCILGASDGVITEALTIDIGNAFQVDTLDRQLFYSPDQDGLVSSTTHGLRMTVFLPHPFRHVKWS